MKIKFSIQTSLILMLPCWSIATQAVTAQEFGSKPVISMAKDSLTANADFLNMHYGLFVHYSFPGKKYQYGSTDWIDGSAIQSLDELADNFDAEDLAQKAAAMRAQYVIFTTSHANMNVLFPSKVMDKYLPGHTSKRDVLTDMIKAVKAKNIRVMFYVHPSDGHDFTKEDQERVGYNIQRFYQCLLCRAR